VEEDRDGDRFVCATGEGRRGIAFTLKDAEL